MHSKIRERLSPEQRKKRIQESAKKLFLEKGISKTTMEDVSRESKLSKGGLYYYYNNVTDILLDIVEEGAKKRYQLVMEFFYDNPQMSYEDRIVEATVEKMLDTNEYKTLYMMFLVEAQKDKKFKEISDKMEEDGRKSFIEFVRKNNMSEMECLVKDEFYSFVISIILSTELLNTRNSFNDNRDFLRKIIRMYIKNHKEERDEKRVKG